VKAAAKYYNSATATPEQSSTSRNKRKQTEKKKYTEKKEKNEKKSSEIRPVVVSWSTICSQL